MNSPSSPVSREAGDDAFLRCISMVRSATATMSVEAAFPGEPDLPFRCAEIMNAARAGLDATRQWRREYERQTAEASGHCPPGMDLTFVLLFYCDVLATPAATAAALGPWVLDVSPDAVSFDLAHPWTHPGRVRLRRGDFRVVEDAADRGALAERAYEAHASAFAELYAPGSRLSTHARRAIVADSWAIAWSRATRAAPPRRATCCLIYALPGAHECAGCPRLVGPSRPPASPR
jgi:hypothetical protein